MSYGLPTGSTINYGAIALRQSRIQDAAGGATNTVRPLTRPSGTSRIGGLAVDATPEQWLPIVGWEGLYEVSDLGRVRSLDRELDGKFRKRMRGRVLSPILSGHHYPLVQLCRDGAVERHRVHRLVAQAFLGPCPVGMNVCHWDDNPLNNQLSNLRYGTRSDNMRDRVRNGTHNESSKTHCKRGHEFTLSNTYIFPPTGARRCRACKRLRESQRA